MAISAISLLEIALLTSAGRLRLDLNEILTNLAEQSSLQILPLDANTAREVPYLTVLSDPMDMTIVATARVHQLTLLTSDQRIIESGLVKTIA